MFATNGGSEPRSTKPGGIVRLYLVVLYTPDPGYETRSFEGLASWFESSQGYNEDWSVFHEEV